MIYQVSEERRGPSGLIWVAAYLNIFFKTFQRPYIHRLRHGHLALIVVEKSQVVDRGQRRCVLRTLCLLVSFQRPQ